MRIAVPGELIAAPKELYLASPELPTESLVGAPRRGERVTAEPGCAARLLSR